jgi:hypothetical protein
VVHQTGRFTRYTAESPAAAWDVFIFFQKLPNRREVLDVTSQQK